VLLTPAAIIKPFKAKVMNILRLTQVNDLLKRCQQATSMAIYFAEQIKQNNSNDIAWVRANHYVEIYQSAHEELMKLQYGKVLNSIIDLDIDTPHPLETKTLTPQFSTT